MHLNLSLFISKQGGEKVKTCDMSNGALRLKTSPPAAAWGVYRHTGENIAVTHEQKNYTLSFLFSF